MPVIQINNYATHVQELNKGARETVVLVHGIFGNMAVYYFSIAPILAEQFHVVMYDIKSHGLSERAPNGYDLISLTDDLAALITTLGLTKVHLAGYSFGSLIALKMAIRFPEKVEKLIIIEGPDPNDNEPRNAIRDYSRELFDLYLTVGSKFTHLRLGTRQAELKHRVYDFLIHQTSLKNDMLLERDFFSEPEIDQIPHETLLVYGADSSCCETGKYLQQKIKKSTFALFEGDHRLPIQAPVPVGNAMKTFLEN